MAQAGLGRVHSESGPPITPESAKGAPDTVTVLRAFLKKRMDRRGIFYAKYLLYPSANEHGVIIGLQYGKVGEMGEKWHSRSMNAT